MARLKVKPDRIEALQRLTASYDELAVPGFVGTHVYRMDADETKYYLVVLFRGPRADGLASSVAPPHLAQRWEMKLVAWSRPMH